MPWDAAGSQLENRALIGLSLHIVVSTSKQATEGRLDVYHSSTLTFPLDALELQVVRTTLITPDLSVGRTSTSFGCTHSVGTAWHQLVVERLLRSGIVFSAVSSLSTGTPGGPWACGAGNGVHRMLDEYRFRFLNDARIDLRDQLKVDTSAVTGNFKSITAIGLVRLNCLLPLGNMNARERERGQ